MVQHAQDGDFPVDALSILKDIKDIGYALDGYSASWIRGVIKSLSHASVRACDHIETASRSTHIKPFPFSCKRDKTAASSVVVADHTSCRLDSRQIHPCQHSHPRVAP